MKKIIFTIIIFAISLPAFALADADHQTDAVFIAQVIEVVEQREFKISEHENTTQQKLKLKILNGEEKGKTVEFNGFDDFEVLSSNLYGVGDRVQVLKSLNNEGLAAYFITDYVRSTYLFYLTLLFVAVTLLVGRIKGARSLLSLVATFFVILKFIIPKILLGANPLIITLIGSFFILLAIIYITEGFEPISHIAVVSISISLIISIAGSWIFVELTKLTGVASEEVAYLVNVGNSVINFKGLLLAAIIIGLLGVLDDVVIAQISTVKQIYETDTYLSQKNLFRKSFEVGISHISSMTNTLFLAYAGASLPLLVLFVSGQSAFVSFNQIINNEAVATEIVRTLTGSIGLILSVPISTLLAVKWYSKKK